MNEPERNLIWWVRRWAATAVLGFAIGAAAALIYFLILTMPLPASEARYRRTTAPVAAAVSHRRPTLTVWKSDGCAPCRRFWAAYQKDRRFRAIIDRHFAIRWVDVDQWSRPALILNGIKSWPTFQTPRGRIVGFTSADDLLARLGLPGINRSKPDFHLPVPQPKPKPKPTKPPESSPPKTAPPKPGGAQTPKRATPDRLKTIIDQIGELVGALDAINNRIDRIDRQGSVAPIKPSPRPTPTPTPQGEAGAGDGSFVDTALAWATPLAIGAGGPVAGIGVFMLRAYLRRRRRKRRQPPPDSAAGDGKDTVDDVGDENPPRDPATPDPPERYRKHAEDLAGILEANAGRDLLWDQHLGRLLETELETKVSEVADDTVREVLTGVLARARRETQRIFTKGASRSSGVQ